MTQRDTILIIDFGSQYTQLIARRIREANVYSEIHAHTFPIEEIKLMKPKGIILSGGPMSVYDKDAPQINSEIFQLGIPILGICYGLQLICKYFKGQVEPANEREYGKAVLIIKNQSLLLQGIENNSVVWMSHGDHLTSLPDGFIQNAFSENSPYCAISNESKKIYGVQFHPEVMHTQQGNKIISNFLFNICDCTGDWTPAHFIEQSIERIKNVSGNNKVLCALSGGVDSTVAAVLVQKAIGENLTCVHINSGMMRKNESESILELFKDKLHLNIIYVDASEIFLSRLKGISEPELKRKIIGNTFIDVFEEESKKIGGIKFLVQGTLYPDVIESVSVKGKSVTIKTHHNVGGLPDKMNFKLIEPFRELFKDEVRKVGNALSIPNDFISRHPFPGPGLGIRVIGDVTFERLEILRSADDIFISEIKKAGLYDFIWQAAVMLLPIQTVGVMGDARTYENVAALRAVTSTDGMTADWFRFEHDFLELVSNKIINNVRGINRVVYDISSKPPSTIEWE